MKIVSTLMLAVSISRFILVLEYTLTLTAIQKLQTVDGLAGAGEGGRGGGEGGEGHGSRASSASRSGGGGRSSKSAGVQGEEAGRQTGIADRAPTRGSTVAGNPAENQQLMGAPVADMIVPAKNTQVAPQKKGLEPLDYLILMTLLYHGHFVYKHDPCELYRENLKSKPNKRRMKGCKHAADRMKKAIKKNPSKNCPQIITGRCFQRTQGVGRCYVQIDTKNTPDSWVLINLC